MHTFLDKNKVPIKIGDNVRVQYCCGRYGQTRIVTGTLTEMNEHGGIRITLSKDQHPFREDMGRFGTREKKSGDSHYIANAFSWNSELNARVGYGKHNDYEHGHEFWCEIIQPESEVK